LEEDRILPLSSRGKAAHDGSRLELEGVAFEFSRRNVLRSGDISRTALRHLPRAVRQLLPHSILHLKETKWAGPARLIRAGRELSGFAIHELVHFHPQDT